jgi:hypothetical protein
VETVNEARVLEGFYEEGGMGGGRIVDEADGLKASESDL